MDEKWTRAASVNDFAAGCGVRFRDGFDNSWQTGDRALGRDGVVRHVHPESVSDALEWLPEELLEDWEIVEVLVRPDNTEDVLAVLDACPDLPDDWGEHNPDAIKAFTGPFREWKARANELVAKLKGETK